ncbi:MAG TPA: response regulator [Pyrinomonadaceae bacterium]|jgi:PAS domain S-box-containing protein|nr:response regulator [Pyrinomonadaceae bacterium]
MNKTHIGKILVVDDEVELKNILVESLISQGYETRGFTSADTALDALRAEAFDVVLTDLMMPGMDGITLVQEGLEIDPHLICIVMTGQGTIQTAVDAMKVGAFDYILKPFRLHTLLPLITRAMNVRHMRLENLQLRETLAIFELAQTIALTLDPQTVISKLVDAVLQHTNADEVSVLLPVSDGHNELYVAAVRGENRERLLGQRVPLDESISGWITRERQPLMLQGEVNDQRFRSLWPHPEITSSISIPMQVANKVVGTLNINALRRPRPFNLVEMKVLTILAGTAAAALESASLYTQVRRAEENYRSIFENAVEGIFQSTPERRLITVNPSMARILGYDSPQQLIDSLDDIGAELYVNPEQAEEVTRTLEQEGIVQGFEFEAYRKDREKIWLSLNIRLVRDEEGKPLFREGAIEDITEQKRAELERGKLEEQLRQSQKMEAIGQLAGGVAHDFNNLLTAINGYSSLALQRTNPDARVKTYLEEIRKAGDRATNLTRQLLAFGRKQMLKPVAMNLNDVVSDMNKMLRRLIGEDIKLVAKLSPELKKIKADAGQIEQVLVNLVVNSRDAMPQGGVLTIETTNFEVDPKYNSKHLGLPPGGYVMLAVSDTGCGMDQETRARIFEPFFTTKDKGKGTGLGLSTVYGIVKQSGGNIWVYSEPSRGTTLKVYLPQLEGEEQPVERVPAESAAPGGWETILLVEDEDIVRGLARQILEQAGYQVHDASGGEEALRLCRELTEPIHLLLTDVVMPETSGKEIAQRLASLRPEARVLFMSGYTDDAIVHHGVLDSNVEFIQKPFTPVALARKVREVLDLNCSDQCKKLSRGGLQDDRE